MKRLSLITFLALPAVAPAGLSVNVALNSDSTVDTEFPAGDKPISGGTCPTGWTCATKGDATEDIDEVSATSFTIVAKGKNDEGNIAYAYKTTSTDDDIQVTATLPSSWTGHTETYTAFGVGLTEGTGDADYADQCAWPHGIARAQYKSDAGGAGESETLGLTGQSLPRYVGIKYDDSLTTISCWESDNGTDWFQVGTDTTKSLTFPVLGYVFGTSHDSNSTTTATPTNIDHSNTITIDPEGGGGEPDPPSGQCTLHFGPWDYSTEDAGQAQSVSGTWTLSTSGVDDVDSKLEIIAASNDPLIVGEKYFRSTCDKGDGCKRTERALAAGNNGDPFRNTSMVEVSGDNLRATEPYWVAFLMRIDDVGSGGPLGFYQQWHAPNVVAGSSSPHHGLRGRGDRIDFYFKDRDNDAAQGVYENVYHDIDLDWPAIQGQTIKYIYHIYWDGRTTGNEGFLRLYINDETTPRLNLESSRNLTYGDTESDGAPTPNSHPYFKHGLYIVDGGLTGDYIQSYSRILIGGEDCTRADIEAQLE